MPDLSGGHAPRRILHTMLRVRDLQRSLHFYVDLLGMTLHRREDYPEGRFTLAFVGYGDSAREPTLELTHNWQGEGYAHGTGFGHIALEVADATATCAFLASHGVVVTRPGGPMTFHSPQRHSAEVIAFVTDPDGYKVELIEGPQPISDEGGYRDIAPCDPAGGG